MRLADAIKQWELSIQAGGPGSGRHKGGGSQQDLADADALQRITDKMAPKSGWARLAQNERDSRAADKNQGLVYPPYPPNLQPKGESRAVWDRPNKNQGLVYPPYPPNLQPKGEGRAVWDRPKDSSVVKQHGDPAMPGDTKGWKYKAPPKDKDTSKIKWQARPGDDVEAEGKKCPCCGK